MLVRPSRHSDESEAGYALRLAACNGLDRATWIERLAVSPHERLRYCPTCLSRPQPYWREAWLGEIPFCEEHSAWLVDECHQCHRLLTLHSAHLDRCRCGAVLAEARVSLVPDPVLSAIKVTKPDVLTWLGALSIHGLWGKPLKRRQSQRVDQCAALLEAGAEIAQGWPASFETLLERWQSRTALSPSLLNAAYPGLMRRIGKAPEPPWRSRLIDAVNAYAKKSRQGNRPILGRNAPPSTTLAEVARRLNVRTETVAASIDELAPKSAVLLRSGRRRRVITPEQENRLKVQLRERRSLSYAAEYLGFALARLRLMCDEGLLVISGRGISQSAVDYFKSRLIQQATRARLAKGDRCLAHVLRTVITRAETGHFLRHLFAGGMTLHLRSNPGPVAERLFLSVHEVQRWRQSKRASAKPDAVSIDEARRILNVKREVICHLIRQGHVRTIEGRHGRRRSTLIPADELKRAIARFVPLSALAKKSGISPKHAPAWAKTKGIQLVAGPSIDGCRQYIARTFDAGSGQPPH